MIIIKGFRFICFCFISLAPLQCIAQNLYNYENSAAFAAYLEQTQQFSLAAAEYERLIYLNPTADSLGYKLLFAYRKAGLNSVGLKRAESMYPKLKQMPADVARTYAGMLLEEKIFAQADTFLHLNNRLPAEDRFLFLGTSQALHSNWSEAQKFYSRVSPMQRPIVVQYQQVTLQALAQRRKSPALAAGLSALMPGAGKVYTRDWKDGLMALVLVGTSAWQAQRAFKQSGSDSVRGWIFASVSTGFYIGNIFGSFKAAKVYNQRQNEYHQKAIENIFSADF